METTGLQALNTLKEGRRGIIVTVAGDRQARKRLLVMGLHVGEEVEMLLQGKDGSPMLVAAGETRFALGADMAEDIFISASPGQFPVWDAARMRVAQCFKKACKGGHHETMFGRFRGRKQRKNCRLRQGKCDVS